MNRRDDALVTIGYVRTSWLIQVIGSGIYREFGGCLGKQGIGFFKVKWGTKVKMSKHMHHM